MPLRLARRYYWRWALRVLTEGDEENDAVVDVDHWPKEADERQGARCNHIGQNQLALEPITDEGRTDVGDALGEGEQRQREGRLLRFNLLQLHVIRLQARYKNTIKPAIIEQSKRKLAPHKKTKVQKH